MRMKFHWMIGLAVAVFASTLAWAAQESIRPIPKPTRGQELYSANCAVCHGAEGRGDGPAAYLIYPEPRDFTRGIFKFRSTLTIPTNADLLRTITRGIPGTAMPAWGNLSPSDRQTLVDYVKSFSSVFAKSVQPVKIPNPPRITPQMVTAGKQLYVDAGCNSCHGPAGRGDGPSVADLRDEWGFPIRPRDLTRPDLFKQGSTLQNIFKVIQVGVGGTPMPVFGDTLTPQQSWELVAYVQSLARAPVHPALGSPSGVITAKLLSSALDAAEPFNAVWERVAPVEVSLMNLWAREKTIGSLRIRALYTEKDLAICMEWDDPTADLAASRPQTFADAVAVQFPLGAKAPSFTMGEKGGGVDIWYWKADNGMKAVADSFTQTYPNLAIDEYPFDSDTVFATSRAVGNRLYSVAPGSRATELNAEGFGTLTPQPDDDQQVRGSGVWRAGRWRVVMIRPLNTGSVRDRTIKVGETVPAAFAVWDGAQNDRNGQKAVSVWQQLRLEKRRP